MDDLPQLRAVCAIGFENHNGTSSFQADIGCFDPGRRQQIRSQSSCTVFASHSYYGEAQNCLTGREVCRHCKGDVRCL